MLLRDEIDEEREAANVQQLYRHQSDSSDLRGLVGGVPDGRRDDVALGAEAEVMTGSRGAPPEPIPDFADAIDPNATHNSRRRHDGSLEAVVRAAALATLRYEVSSGRVLALAEGIARSVMTVLVVEERTKREFGVATHDPIQAHPDYERVRGTWDDALKVCEAACRDLQARLERRAEAEAQYEFCDCNIGDCIRHYRRCREDERQRRRRADASEDAGSSAPRRVWIVEMPGPIKNAAFSTKDGALRYLGKQPRRTLPDCWVTRLDLDDEHDRNGVRFTGREFIDLANLPPDL